MLRVTLVTLFNGSRDAVMARVTLFRPRVTLEQTCDVVCARGRPRVMLCDASRDAFGVSRDAARDALSVSLGGREGGGGPAGGRI